MARIRTVKPEAFFSESLAEVSVEAERAFFGLLTQADDHGRHRDLAAIIAGLLWPLRAEHTPVHVENDLQQLADAALICRYTGCDGRRYLHIMTWSDHQKIDKPSQSRLPSCPQHHAEARCGACKGPCTRRAEASPTPPAEFGEPSPNPPRALDQPSRRGPAKPAPRRGEPAADQDALVDLAQAASLNNPEIAGRTAFPEGSPKPPRNLAEGSAPGSRILDPGSSSPTGRTAPGDIVSANQLVSEYVAACDRRPPNDVIGHLGRIVKKLLTEGIPPEHVRAGLRNFAANPKHPSVLTSMVNEAMNAPAGLARPGNRPTVPAHRAWTNPADAATAYAEDL